MAWAAGIAAGSRISTATETLDRVVASIDRQAITTKDVEQEYRFERFLDAQWPPPPPDAAQLAGARERLTDQLVLTREENPGPTDRAESEKSAALRMDALRKQYAHPEDYQQALKDLGMNEGEVAAHVAQDELMLRLIDQRLRPAATPSDGAIADYYQSTFVPDFRRKSGSATAPPISEVADQIREILTQKRINELLDQWIEELKPTTNLRLHTF